MPTGDDGWMILEPIKPRVLGLRMIPDVAPDLARDLKLEPHHRSLGLITCTSDDALYAALDEATKAADVDVVYAKSFYAGSAHASGPLSGEVIGILAATDPEIVSSGLQACLRYLDAKAWFYAANESGSLAFFPHVIPSVGRYLSKVAGVEPGTPMAYLIAPPIEATIGLDAALKVADVSMKAFYAPPSETNYAGGLLTCTLEAVQAAAAAFQDAVLDLSTRPQVLTPVPDMECLTERFGRARAAKGSGHKAKYRILDSGLELDVKPDGFTHLFDNQSLVPKGHPAIRFRGNLDLLQAYVLEAQVAALAEGFGDVSRDLDDVLKYLREIMGAEVLGRPMPEPVVAGFSAEELHRLSHNTMKFLSVGWVLPDASMGATVVKLNLVRAFCRQVEIVAADAFGGESHLTPDNRDRLLHGFNRLSNVIYVLVCRTVGKVSAARQIAATKQP
jgi:ethanolamine utilization protein EutL